MVNIAYLQAISPFYYEAASIDGASKFQQFRYITIPMLAPALTVNTLLLLTNGLKVYDQEIGEALAYAEALCRAAGSQLTPLLPSGKKFFPIDIAKRSTMQYLTSILTLSPREREYMESFSKGIYKPELLLSDPEIIRRIRSGSLWA